MLLTVFEQALLSLKRGPLRGLTSAAGVLLLTACQTGNLPPVPSAPRVDLPRFMGDWYVIANIPTWPEEGAHNAVESYRLAADGNIDIRFTFRADAFDGKAKQMTSRGFVSPQDPAIWGVQFLWPLKADYRIAYLSDDYQQTIIAREKRDYVWIMARTPTLPDAEYQRLLRLVSELGYDRAKVLRVPQRWN